MDDLLRDITTFCKAHNIAETRFGRDAVKDTTLIRDLKAGREPRRRTVERVRHFMATYGARQDIAA